MRFIVLVLLTASPAALAIPTQIGHQGRILDADGLPAEGPHTLDFALYDASEEGAVMWSEAHDVDLVNGYYSLVLGADELDNPLDDDLLRDNDLFLELIVDDDDALSPRQALNAVPYARLADTSTNVSGGVVDASEIRVGGTVVVDGSGAWSGSTPAVDWSDLSGVPAGLMDGEDADTTLTEDEVDAYCADNGYAMASDLASVATSGSYDDLSDVPVTGASANHYTESGSFTVPDGITSLSIYVAGGGGGGSNGESTSLDLGSHSHAVSEHSHDGGTHNHGSGEHSHDVEGSSVTTYDPCASTTGCCGCSGRYTTETVVAHTTGSATGTTSDATTGATSSTGLTTDGADSAGASVPQSGGDGGSGGGMNALVTVSPGVECEFVIGTAGDVAAAGTSTTITCADQSVECGGGSAGASDGVDGDDGVCTLTGGTQLLAYKAARFSPGGGGSGGNGSGASAGQAGTVTVRY